MRKQYASSVYSQKSTTSAKSGKSFLSLATPIWPSSSSNTNSNQTTKDDITLNETKQGVWYSLKSWVPSNNNGTSTKKKKNDEDSIATRSSTSSSISKLKQLFVSSNSKNKKSSSPFSITGANNSLPRLSLDTLELQAEEDSVSSSSDNKPSPLHNSSSTGPIGILINRGEDSAEAIAERKRRRHQRRENILKLQKHHRSLHHHQQSRFHHQEEQQQIESSSSDTLLTDDADHYHHPTSSKRIVSFQNEDEQDDDDRWGYNPRIMFVEPSPVPRFRNAAPPPPPSPLYLNILVDKGIEGIDNTIHSIIKSPATDEDEPTIFASKDSIIAKRQSAPQEDEWQMNDNTFMDEHDRQMSLLIEHLKPRLPQKPRLCFYAPFRRGQTLQFSLQNTIPEDHIILFKFLTSNVSPNIKGQPERYFVRPSAGKMVSTDQKDIILFLNQVPFDAEHEKDKIMIRWAVIQKGTQIEEWVNSLQESTRRKWIDMLDEQWPDQVTIRMTRIKVRFST
jgi:hypothetical protein